MIYVTSDLRGLELSKLRQLLDKANFGADDWLFVLGDVVDRENDGGVSLLLWLMEQPNAELLLGNHEAMLLSCDFLFEDITDEAIAHLDAGKMELLSNYMLNGGEVTLTALRALKARSPESVAYILEYLREAPLYTTVTAGGRDYLLCHAGLDHFEPHKKLSDYAADDFLWAAPEKETCYFDGVTTVFGHTPTYAYGSEWQGRILKTDTWIDVDVGVPFGNPPALLRLADLKESYL